MESPLTMVFHGAIIGIVLYFLMTLVLKQPIIIAQTRSVLAGLLIATYMIVFGHRFPPYHVNPLLKM